MSNKLSFTSVAAVLGVVVCLWLSAGPRADVYWADTNHDGVVNSLDIDAIYQHLTVAPSCYDGTWPRPLVPYQAQYDVNGDGVVSQADVTYELTYAFQTTYGDANLDKVVGFADFQAILNHWQASGPSIGWAEGDFNGDGIVDQRDMWGMGIRPGDANMDTKVDFTDFQTLLNHWQATGAGWAGGDFNFDGVTDFLDFQLMLNYWNPAGYTPGGRTFAPSEQAPEPASLSLLALGGLALLRRKK